MNESERGGFRDDDDEGWMEQRKHSSSKVEEQKWAKLQRFNRVAYLLLRFLTAYILSKPWPKPSFTKSAGGQKIMLWSLLSKSSENYMG